MLDLSCKGLSSVLRVPWLPESLIVRSAQLRHTCPVLCIFPMLISTCSLSHQEKYILYLSATVHIGNIIPPNTVLPPSGQPMWLIQLLGCGLDCGVSHFSSTPFLPNHKSHCSLPWTRRDQSSFTLMPSTTITPRPRPTRSSFCHHFCACSGLSASDSLSAKPPWPLSAPTTRMLSYLSHAWSFCT